MDHHLPATSISDNFGGLIRTPGFWPIEVMPFIAEQVHPVKPAVPISRFNVQLSAVDMLAAHLNNAALFFFKISSPNTPKQLIFDCIRTGLSEALAEFPSMLGKVIVAERRIKVERDAVVKLICKDYTSEELSPQWMHGTFADLEALHFPSTLLNRKLLVTEDPEAAMTAQVSFIKGGAILSYRTHHAAVDGIGQGAIHTRWAHHTRAVMQGEQRPDTGPRPTPTEARDRSSSLVPSPIPLAVDISCAPFLRWKDPSAPPPDPRILDPRTRLISHWRLSPSSIAALKRLASSTNPADPSISTADAYAAYLWRSIVLARRKSRKSRPSRTTSKLLAAVNVRGVLGLDASYIGNAILPAPVEATNVDAWTHETPLYGIARSLREAVSQYARDDGARARAALAFLQNLPGVVAGGGGKIVPELNTDAFAPGSLDGGITNMSSLGWLTEDDWGPALGGKPRAVRRCGENVMSPGMIMVHARCPDGSLVVELSLEDEATEALRRDKEFAKYVEFLGY